MSSIPWPFPELGARISSIRQRGRHRLLAWARKRQGTDPETTTLRPGRVYILPTGVGLVFGLMSFAMLLGSMNYNNNLSFVLTFILVGIGFVAMHQCQRNLVGLELTYAGAEPVFAGQAMRFRIAMTNHSKNARYGIRLYATGTWSEKHDLQPGESKIFNLPVPTKNRGRITLERFGVRTMFPFELFRSWAWLHMNINGLVYPVPADHAPEPPPTMTARGHRQHDARGEEDFAGLRKYHEGDSPRHVAWKAYASSGQLLSKQFAGADTSSQWFDFNEIPATGVEQRLSILTRWIVDADRTLEDYGLRMPGAEFGPAHGEAHRRRCLEALALFDLQEHR
ncbi:MAG: DUF58 domain-containing protein [Gammaproteobacteria bacterium]|nr:DUF58 domain-containing protein [Gammaproteobacteria bacterium]